MATDQAKEEKLNEFIRVHDQIMDFFIFKMDKFVDSWLASYAGQKWLELTVKQRFLSQLNLQLIQGNPKK